MPLSWITDDPEQRLAFPGGRHTRVNHFLTAIMGGLATASFFAVLYPFRQSGIGVPFYREGSWMVSGAIVFFTAWSLAILLMKSLKLRLQRKTLALSVVPDDPDFVLSPQTVACVQDEIYRAVDDPRHFVLMNRISTALANLRNLGRVGDVDEILKSQSEHDESSMETSYLILQSFVWAVPVLGFIGTVLGLSTAIGNFGGVLASAEDLSRIKEELQGITGGLATAFETTLQGLVAALAVQLLATWVKKSEEEFLDSCREYCSRHIVSRLRLLPFEFETEPGVLPSAVDANR